MPNRRTVIVCKLRVVSLAVARQWAKRRKWIRITDPRTGASWSNRMQKYRNPGDCSIGARGEPQILIIDWVGEFL